MKQHDPYADFTLLRDGKQAFPAILSAIEAAKEALHINMFIWRDDEIGNRMAAAVLAAAEHGVRVTLVVDRYGVVLEKAEETKKSFFHKTLTLAERLKIWGLSLLYPMSGTPRRAHDEQTPLYHAIMSHPNITVSCDTFRADHSKFYVIDERILFLGGINIEDKENGRDMQGRIYSDYMVRIEGEDYVRAFYKKLQKGQESPDLPCSFPMNVKEKGTRRFELEGHYLDISRGAQKELCIVMAYFSPLPRVLSALADAAARGVRVTVVLPARANFQNDLNRKTARRLLRKTGGKVAVYFSPKMLHTKLVASEKAVSFGSANITKKAFSQLSELNLCVAVTDSPLLLALADSLRDTVKESQRVLDPHKIKYRRPIAFLEGFVV